jgi:hypothetical protein
MKKPILVFLAGAIFSCEARAEFYCADPKMVESRAQGECSNNEYVSEAAVLCLEKLEAEIAAARALVSTAAAAHSQASRKGQEGKEANAGADYAFSEETLARLRKHAEQAQTEIVALDKTVLAMPEDYDEPEVTGLSPEAYLRSVPCFSDNRKVIADVLLDIDEHVSDLEVARGAAAGLKAGTQHNAGAMGSAADLKKATGKKSGAGMGAKEAGSSKSPESTVTGVEEDRTKRKKK